MGDTGTSNVINTGNINSTNFVISNEISSNGNYSFKFQ